MEKRRIIYSLGVTYQTTNKKLKKAISIIEDVFNQIKGDAKLERVHFKHFGDFSLNLEIAYLVNSQDYKKYMDIQQKINFMVKEMFEKEGIEFAYPTQTLFVNKINHY